MCLGKIAKGKIFYLLGTSKSYIKKLFTNLNLNVPDIVSIDGLQYLVIYESIDKSLSFRLLLISLDRDRF